MLREVDPRLNRVRDPRLSEVLGDFDCKGSLPVYLTSVTEILSFSAFLSFKILYFSPKGDGLGHGKPFLSPSG